MDKKMKRKNSKNIVGGRKKQIVNGIQFAGVTALFMLYMVPFLLLIINSFKKKRY